MDRIGKSAYVGARVLGERARRRGICAKRRETKGGGRSRCSTAKSPEHKARRVRCTGSSAEREGCADYDARDVPVSTLRKRWKEHRRRRHRSETPAAFLRHPSARAFVSSCTVPVRPALFELSQWRNKTSTRGSNSTPKPKRSLCCLSPRRAEAPLPSLPLPSSPVLLPCSPTPTRRATPRLRILSPFSLPSSCVGSANNKTTPRALWHYRFHRVAFRLPFLRFLSYFHLPSFPVTPFPRSRAHHLFRRFAVEAAAFRNASTSRGTKGKGWWCKMSPLCRRERAYTSMFFELRCESPAVPWLAR